MDYAIYTKHIFDKIIKSYYEISCIKHYWPLSIIKPSHLSFDSESWPIHNFKNIPLHMPHCSDLST